MRVGLVAPPWFPVPPPGYGGTEVVVDNLARGLQSRGHEIGLFTVGESTSPVFRQYLYPSAIAVQPMGAAVAEAAHLLAAYDALADVDVIHDHTVLGPLLAGRRQAGQPPVVTTNHGLFTAQTSRVFAAIAQHASIVAISTSQARTAAGIPIAAVIHHGIDLDVYRPGPGDGGYLLFMGRMSPDKGVDCAVRVAKRAGWPLVIVTKMRDPDEHTYFERQVQPLLDGQILAGEQPLARRLKLLRSARALLNPVRWVEPFGLVMAEALASGTPVLAFPNGAAAEIVDHGVTGYLCRDEDEMVAAVDRVGELQRASCRLAAEQRFSLPRMAREYERLYRRILDFRSPLPRQRPTADPDRQRA
jgi:glycosyltransferase involved in cell wall biosynthesis